MSEADRRIESVRRWMTKARTDLALASIVLQRGPDMDPWAACFHAQQTVEKAMKAILISRGLEPPFTHNLVALAAVLPGDIELGASLSELAELSAAARGTRYVTDPTGDEDPTWEEAEAAVAVAERTNAAIRVILGEPR